MRSLLVILVIGTVVAAMSCGPTPSQLRLQRVQQARGGAQLAGPRQAQEYAAAVHAAHKAGDYKVNPQLGATDASDAIAVIDRAVPSAGVDAPTLIAWRAMMFLDLGRTDDALAEFNRSFALGPNELAGTILIEAYGGANRPDKVGPLCATTVAILRSDDDRLSLIATCRKNMNALSPEGEMAWMSPELVTWYQAENARRMGAVIDAQNARVEQDRRERNVVRGMEQCAATCKEDGLYCQNDCHGNRTCDNRCVEINRACLDRCESRAYQRLDR